MEPVVRLLRISDGAQLEVVGLSRDGVGGFAFADAEGPLGEAASLHLARTRRVDASALVEPEARDFSITAWMTFAPSSSSAGR